MPIFSFYHDFSFLLKFFDFPNVFYVDVTSVTGLKFLPPYYSNYGTGENQQIILRCKVRSDVEPNFLVSLIYV